MKIFLVGMWCIVSAMYGTVILSYYREETDEFIGQLTDFVNCVRTLAICITFVFAMINWFPA